MIGQTTHPQSVATDQRERSVHTFLRPGEKAPVPDRTRPPQCSPSETATRDANQELPRLRNGESDTRSALVCINARDRKSVRPLNRGSIPQPD